MSFTNKSLFLGVGFAISTYLFLAICSTIIHALGSFPALESLFFQNLICLAILLPYAYRKKELKFSFQNIGPHLFRDISGILSFIAYYFAIQKLNLVDATILSYTAPFFTPFLWVLYSKEDHFEKDVLWTIIIGFIGIAFILKPSAKILNIGAFLGILSGLFSSIATISLRVLNVRKEPLSRTLIYYFFLGTVLMLPFFSMFVLPSLHQMLLLLGLGIFMAIGQILITIAYRYGTASFLSPISYTMIPFTALLSWLLFQMPPGWFSIIGALLIITGGCVTFFFRSRKL